ncbi:MAG: 4Fe-4S ferredoxin [Candidatus Lokiarchaeota archaeon]|nr:4Fe-4S ferredoxin [Candidatus Lokiarchaeota archaeon]
MRNIVEIDKEKCTGCGQCIIKCAEGALKIIDGKAEIVSDKYCDGLGACIGECPEGALRIIMREAEDFDELAVETNLKAQESHQCEHHQEGHECGHLEGEEVPTCISTKFKALFDATEPEVIKKNQWPIKIQLINPKSQFSDSKEIVLIADCVPPVYDKIHTFRSNDTPIVITCPKFTDTDLIISKLKQILDNPRLENVKIIQMEVPCCSKLRFITQQLIESLNNRNIIIQNEIISTKGEKLSEEVC